MVALLGLKDPQLAVKLTTTPEETVPSTAATTVTADVSSAPMLVGDAAMLLNVTFDAVVPKFRLPVTAVPLTVADADKVAAPVVVKLRGLIKTFATPLLSVNAVAAAALPANVATVKSVEKVTN